MNTNSEEKLNRIVDCRELYLRYGGQRHEEIEREMRELGYADFHRRVLYRRFERGRCVEGWVGRYGFNSLLAERSSARNIFTAETLRRGEGEATEGKLIQMDGSAKNLPKSHNLIDNPSVLPQRLSDSAVQTSKDTLTIEPLKRGELKDIWPQINADNTDKETVEINFPNSRHLRLSAAKNLSRRLSGSAVKTSADDFDEFKQWLKVVSPLMTWDWKHQVYIYKYLKRVYDGECKRLMIFVPPRHGKSELVTVRYAAYVIKTDPSKNVIIGSYNQRLANRFSRKIKRVLSDDSVLTAETQRRGEGGTNTETPGPSDKKAGQSANSANSKVLSQRLSDSAVKTPDESSFPFIKPRQANSEAEWETREGGGLRAVGVGSGVTGFGANLIIVDDPVKSRSEAESERMRENVWDWFNDDLYTRLEPDGSIILIQTRWHEDDLAGRLLREAREEGGEQWEVVNLPALAESNFTAETQSRGDLKENWPQIDADIADIKIAELNFPDPRHLRLSAAKDLSRRLSDSAVQTSGIPLGRISAESNFTAETLSRGEEEEEGFRQLDEADRSLQKSDDPRNNSNLPPQRLSDSAVQTPVDELGRAPGEALCPDRFDENALGRLKRKLGTYSFAALYQQRPVPAEGGLFKRAWFNIVSHAPPNLRWKRGTDPGISGKSDADYTASFRIAYDREGSMYIDGGYRRQMEYPELRKFILGRILAEPDTEHGIELSAHGNAILQDLRREKSVRGRAFRGIRVKDSKVARALSWIALAEEGKVFLIRAAWNQEFLDEAAAFPTGTHDDQIDAVSLAVKMATQQKNRGYGFVIW